MIRLGVFALLTMFLGATTWAGPFDKSRVPKTATWVVHLDAERLLKSGVGQQLLDELSQGKAAGQVDAFQNIFSLDLGKDLKAVTAYGPDVNSSRGVAIATGNFDAGKIAAQLLNRQSYSQQRHGSRTIHGWTTRHTVAGTGADGRPATRTVAVQGYACIPSPSMVILSQDADDVRAALDVMDGKQPVVSSKYILDQMRLSGPNTILVGATELGRTGVSSIPPEIGRNLQNVCLFMGELGKTFVTIVEAETPSANAAAQLKLVTMGVIASAVLQAGSKPDLARLARNAKVGTSDNRVSLTIRYPSIDFVAMLKRGTLFSSAQYFLQPPRSAPAAR